jgi:hypothetical protein
VAPDIKMSARQFPLGMRHQIYGKFIREKIIRRKATGDAGNKEPAKSSLSLFFLSAFFTACKCNK